jgi:tetratricopeptide (TPR) repeat protein
MNGLAHVPRPRPSPGSALPVLALLALLAGCPTARPGPSAACPTCGVAGGAPAAARGPVQLAFEPQRIEVTPADLELVGKNDEELLAIGQAALAARGFERAAAAFDRLVELHPGSRHLAAALYQAGVAHQRLEQWRVALERFGALRRRSDGPDALEAAFRSAECHYHLDELAEAAAVLGQLAGRTDLPPGEQIRALTQLGIVELEDGRLEAAEGHLRLAVSAWRAGSEQARLDDYYPSQAQHHLGEVYRARFLAVRLDPSRDGEAQLARELEAKASLLLSAQGHYLRAIRMGNGDWAVASGYRIGELYDALHAALVEAPPPPGLDAEQVAAYRTELTRKVRVLVVKAITIYEQTLAVAGRTRVEDNRFVAETRASLERMKQALRDVPADDAPAPEPVLPPDAEPGRGEPGPGGAP